MSEQTSLVVGQTAPPLQRRIELPDMVAYAGATWDWHRTHYDADYVASKQLPGPIVDGQVFGALFVELLQDWLGPRCFVQHLAFSFRNLMFAGETVRCEATVTEVEADRVGVALTATILAATDHAEAAPSDRYAVKPASAVVLLGRADGPAA